MSTLLAKRKRQDDGNRDLDVPAKRRGHRWETTNISGHARVHQGDVFNTVTYINAINTEIESSNKELDARFETLHQSLLFDRVDARLANIREPLRRTCTWLFDHPCYLTWSDTTKSSDHNGFLWIRGKPGCGKSTIMKMALEHLRERHPSDTIIHYFFNARGSSSLEKSSLGLYRWLTYQILEVQPRLQAVFTKLFRFKNPSAVVDDWTVNELQGFMKKVIRSRQQQIAMCVFIDALDEGEALDDIRDMVTFLIELVEMAAEDDSKCRLRICLSSRHYPNIDVMKGVTLVVEEQSEQKRDMMTYINHRLSVADPVARSELAMEVLTKANGVFLWAVLVIDILNALQSSGNLVSAMKSRLATIPTNTNNLIRDIIVDSTAKNPDGSKETLLFLQWMLFAKEPLSQDELYLATKFGNGSIGKSLVIPSTEIVQKYILHTSRGLVEIVSGRHGFAGHPRLRRVQFIHETVREYLLGKDGLFCLWPNLGNEPVGPSHDRLKQICADYLSISMTVHERVLDATAGFIAYAAANLLWHAELAQQHTVSQDDFLGSRDSTGSVWHSIEKQWWSSTGNLTRQFHLPSTDKPNNNLLYFLACEGYHHLMSSLVAYTKSLDDVTNGKWGTTLQAACVSGVTESVHVLIDAGVDVNITAGHYHTALQAAAWQGDGDMVAMLLLKGADVTASGGKYGTALQAASSQGHHRCVALLLQHNADVNAVGGTHYTALQAAVHSQSLDTAELLLDAGAELDYTRKGDCIAADEQYWPLISASMLHTSMMTELLLDRGADISVTGGPHHTSLHAAVFVGSERNVELLLRRGANVNFIAGWYHNALQIASFTNRDRIVGLLLDYGAKPDVTGGAYHTALQAAARRGCLQSARCLLQRGADVNGAEAGYDTPLIASSAAGHLDIVQMLLDHGADVNAHGASSYTALLAAVQEGHQSIVRALIKHGADARLSRVAFGKALFDACWRDSQQTIQDLLLLAQIAQLSEEDWRQALVGAVGATAERGNEATLKILLDFATETAPLGQQRHEVLVDAATLGLQEATALGNFDVVHVLLQYGADSCMPNLDGVTPLDFAISEGHEDVVDLMRSYGASTSK